MPGMPTPVSLRGLAITVQSANTAVKTLRLRIPQNPISVDTQGTEPATESTSKHSTDPTQSSPQVPSLNTAEWEDGQTQSSTANAAQKDPSRQLPLSQFNFYRPAPRYHPMPPPLPFVPNNEDPEPLINDLIKRIDYYKTHPRRQEKQEILEHLGQETNQKPTCPDDQGTSNEKSTGFLIGEIYRKYLRDANMPRFQDRDDKNIPFQLKSGGNAPRKPHDKPYPPYTLGQGIRYVNDIWIALNTVSTVSTPTSLTHQSPPFPGRCPYPSLFKQGFHQAKPGSFLRTDRPPQRRTQFSSHQDFEAYIYSLAFHRDISPRTGRMIVDALFKPANEFWLTDTAFRYAIVAFVERVSDLYTARQLAKRMRSVGFGLDTHLHNVFLKGAMKIENLRGFALTLKRMMKRKHTMADGETWNLTLQMGIKLRSVAWVESVLQVMRSRKIPLNLDCLRTVFMVLRNSLDVEKLDHFYRVHCDAMAHVPWKLFHIVLNEICRKDGLDAAWTRLLEMSKKSPPVEATLNLFLRTSFYCNQYPRIWHYLGEFRRRWNVQVNAESLELCFRFAVKEKQWSDALLFYKFAMIQHLRFEMRLGMIRAGKQFEREYGIPLPQNTFDYVATSKAWEIALAGNRQSFPYPQIQNQHLRQARLMRASQLSARYPARLMRGDPDKIPSVVRFWRQIEKTYDLAVKTGLYIPKEIPRTAPFRRKRDWRYVIINGTMTKVKKSIVRRVEAGRNFGVREKFLVWQMVRNGTLELNKHVAMEDGQDAISGVPRGSKE